MSSHNPPRFLEEYFDQIIQQYQEEEEESQIAQPAIEQSVEDEMYFENEYDDFEDVEDGGGYDSSDSNSAGLSNDSVGLGDDGSGAEFDGHEKAEGGDGAAGLDTVFEPVGFEEASADGDCEDNFNICFVCGVLAHVRCNSCEGKLCNEHAATHGHFDD